MPELSEVDLVTAAAIFVLGLLAGALVARLVLPSRRKLRQLVTALDEARTEHQAYRADVSAHFEKTSELVATMTASYKAVYDHLASGAQALCSENAALGAGRFAAPRLVFDQDVDVERIAASAPATSNEPRPAAPDRATAVTSRTDGPVLEMTREMKPATTGDAAQAAPTGDDRDASAPDDDARSPLH